MNIDDTLGDAFVLRINALGAILYGFLLSTAIHVFSKAVCWHIHEPRELHGHLKQAIVRPVSEPIDDTSIEEGRRAGRPIGEVRVGRIHREDNVQVALDVLRKLLVQLFLRIKHLIALPCLLFASSNELGVVVAIEETWHLASRQKGIHTLQESRSEHIALIEDEHCLPLINASLSHHFPEIFIEVEDGVVTASFDLEDGQVLHPSDEPGECGLAHA